MGLGEYGRGVVVGQGRVRQGSDNRAEEKGACAHLISLAVVLDTHRKPWV